MKIIAVIAGLILLAGCSSSPSPVLPPVDLMPLTNKIDVERVWKAKAGEGTGENYLKLKPAIFKNTAYVTDYKGHLFAFDVLTGKTKWDTVLDTPVAGGLSIADDKIMLGNSKGQVIVLSITDGKELWRTQLSSEILSAPAVAKGVLVVRTVDGNIYGLNAEDGRQRWISDNTVPRLTLRGNSSPVISNDIVICALDNGKLIALTLENGKLLWETTIAVPKGRNELERVIDLDDDPVVSDDVVYTAGYQGRLAAVKISSGQLLWSRDFSSYSGLYVDAYRVYITDSEGQVWALNRYNGSTLWRQDKLLRRQLSAPAVQGDYLVVGDYDGYLHWLNRDDGKIMARMRINDRIVLPDDVDDSDKALDLLFSKWNNILTRPVVADKLLMAMDRTGHFEAYRIKQN